MSSPRLRPTATAHIGAAPEPSEAARPSPQAIRGARLASGLTQTEAAHWVRASLRAWQQWEAGDRAMPPGLFELFNAQERPVAAPISRKAVNPGEPTLHTPVMQQYVSHEYLTH